MDSNVGTIDRIIRTIIGIAIAGAGIYYGSWWGLLAIIPLGTASLGQCGMYRPFGWSTAAKHKVKNIGGN